MQSVSFTTQFVVALLLPVTVLGGAFADLVYSCNPSGTITVDNPDSTRFTASFAQTQDGTQNCSTLGIFWDDTVIISGCPTSKNITLWFFEDSIGDDSLPNIITDDFAFYVIRCQQIPATGIYRVVTDESWVTNYISTSVEPSVTPRILLNTQLQDIESGVQRTTAIVGEPLLWEIDGPEGYKIVPLNCTVLSGAGDESIVLIIDGCSEDLYLVTDFDYASETSTNILHANLYAFRFANSDEILIECDMLGCVNTSTSCDFECFGSSDRRRGRRDIFYDHVSDLIERQSARGTAHRESNTQDYHGKSSDLLGQVYTKLRIFGEDGVSIVNGSPRSADSTSLLLISIALLSAVKMSSKIFYLM